MRSCSFIFIVHPTSCGIFQEGVGLVAVNDALWIEGTIYKILRRHFRSEPYYLNVVELFHEVKYKITSY